MQRCPAHEVLRIHLRLPRHQCIYHLKRPVFAFQFSSSNGYTGFRKQRLWRERHRLAEYDQIVLREAAKYAETKNQPFSWPVAHTPPARGFTNNAHLTVTP